MVMSEPPAPNTEADAQSVAIEDMAGVLRSTLTILNPNTCGPTDCLG